MEQLRRNHPALYAARHVVVAILQVLIGVLGIGALLRGLLPRIGLPEIPWPDLPDIPWPDIDVPDLAVLEWVRELWSSVNWLVPIAIAVLVALNEINKRRKRAGAEAARRHEQTGTVRGGS